MKKMRNRCLAITSFLNKKVIVPHSPITLEVEATNCCNEECRMCPRKFMSRPVGHISEALLKKIIEENKNTLELINLFHCGEPLLHPDISKLISICHKANIKVQITTTGSLLTGEMSYALINSGLDMIVFSIDAVTKETYSHIRKANFAETVKNIENFIEMKRRLGRGPFVQVQIVKMEINSFEIKKFQSYWRKKADSVRIKPFYNTGDIASKLNYKIDEKREKPRPCIMLWREPVVCWDGTVLPCCVDLIGQYPIGNIQKDSLKNIWNGEKIQEMRRLHIEGRYKEIELCRNCTIFQVKLPFVLGSVLLDDLTIRKINPFIESLDTVYGLKKFSHF